MAEDEQRLFRWPDYLVFAGSMLLCTLIGLVQGIRDRWGLKKKDGATGEEKDMKIVPVIWSVVATSFSANFVLGFPAEMYYLGTEFGVLCIGLAIGFPTAIFLFVKKFYALGIPSVFDYVGLRFGKELKTTIVVLYALTMLMYMGLIIYAPALAFSEASALSISVAILITGGICLIYTILGGLKGVLWIDTMQMMVVLSIGLANCAYGTYRVGGISKVWDIAQEGNRIDWPSWSANPTIRHSFWTCTVGGIAVVWLLVTNQAVTQKFLGLPKIKEVYIAGAAYMVAIELFSCIYLMTGIVIFAYYTTVGCEPTIAREIERPDQLVPYFVLDIYQDAPGVAGLFVSAVYGASLSTVSAGVNALAAMTMRDIVFPMYKKKGTMPDPKRRVVLFKGLCAFWGLIAMGVAFLAPLMGRSVLQIGLSILALASGPIVGVLILGMYVPFVEKIGAFVGVILAIIFEFTLLIGSIIYRIDPTIKPLTPGICPSPNTTDVLTSSITELQTTQSMMTTTLKQEENTSGFFQVSYLLYSPFGILITTISALIVSVCVRWYKGHMLWPEVDQKLLHLPERAKNVGAGVRNVQETNEIEQKIVKNGDVAAYSPKSDNRKLAEIEKSDIEDQNPLAASLSQTSDLPLAMSLAFAHDHGLAGYQNQAYEADTSSRM